MKIGSVLGALALVVAAGAAFAGPLTPGNLAVVRLTSTGSAAAAVVIDEYTVGGTLVQSITVPTSTSGSQRALTMQGSSTAMGALTRSADGNYLMLGGFDVAPGTATAGYNAAGVGRTIGRLDMFGNIDTSTAITTGFNGNQIRSVASLDGNNFWAAGGTGGVQYVGFGNTITTNGISTGAPTNLRVLNTFNGNVYVSSGSGATTSGVLQFGSGNQTTAAALSILPSFVSNSPSAGSFYDYYFADANTAYVADDSATAGQAGIQKWTLSAGVWSRVAVTAGPAGFRPRQLTGVTVAGVTTLYVAGDTAAGVSTFHSFTDAGGFSTAISTAATGNVFRGIEIIVPSPASMALMGLGGLVVARRRRA